VFGLQHCVETLLKSKGGLIVLPAADVGTIRPHAPCFGIVGELKFQDLLQLRLQARLDDRKGDFNTSIEFELCS